MATDELEEINGIKPNVWLPDGEEREVSSQSSKSVYKVKRTFDHYYCTCPAWRNQSGYPVNARSCKHLKSLLGDKYEEARVKMKNPDGPPAKGAAKAKPASKAKAKAAPKKAAKRVDDEVGDDDEEEVEEKPKASAKPNSKAKAIAKPVSKTSKRKRGAVEDIEEEEEDDGEEEDEEERPAKRGRKATAPSSSKGKGKQKVDEVDEEEEKPKASAKPNSKAKAKAKPVSKTSKRKRGTVEDIEEEEEDDGGEEDEEERPAKRGRKATAPSSSKGKGKQKVDEVDEEEEKPKASAKPNSKAKAKPVSKTSKRAVEDIDEEEEDDGGEEDEEVRPAKHGRKAAAPSSSKGKGNQKDEAEDEADDNEDEEERPAKRDRKATAPSSSKGTGNQKDDAKDEADGNDDKKDDEEIAGKSIPEPLLSTDELEEINGIKPKVWLKDGEEREVSSQSSNSVYKVKRTFDHYYCTCPAWRNQGGCPVNARSCKHLKSLLGDKYEEARVKMKNPDGPPAKGAAKAKPASKAKAKVAPKKTAKRAGDEIDDDEEEEKLEADDDDDEEMASSGKSVPELLLANKWDLEKGLDPTGWWISEKLDGVRTYYDGKQFISRLGNPFTPPNWFLDKLPKDITLDGELYGGRGEFQSTVSIVKTVNSVHWKNITFQIFDIPSRGEDTFEDRYKFLEENFGENGTLKSSQIVVVQHEQATSRDHVLEKLKEIEGLGGEGLMLRKPGSTYEGRRSGSLLKIKTFYDAEAIVTGYAPGKGRNYGSTGALKCKMESGKLFNVGSGLTDKIRKNPPKIGSIIVYRFQELTRDRVPRFPSYVGEAVDKTVPKDAEIPEHRKTATEEA